MSRPLPYDKAMCRGTASRGPFLRKHRPALALAAVLCATSAASQTLYGDKFAGHDLRAVVLKAQFPQKQPSIAFGSEVTFEAYVHEVVQTNTGGWALVLKNIPDDMGKKMGPTFARDNDYGAVCEVPGKQKPVLKFEANLKVKGNFSRVVNERVVLLDGCSYSACIKKPYPAMGGCQ